ncbi:unnamed protein product [Bursaphelenchus okinawaensis]|uniref:Uncharacterized protein n=1 Tax=Bursaphelenchus okinawaensis TaxID=465554 RepID=A0A811KU50_9BILA|nr:unnamed protein product [Bursaphelenchus okinawaensis]CAG9111675.1 unnamed protein product [Bursaphelenchus okinawaensis]
MGYLFAEVTYFPRLPICRRYLFAEVTYLPRLPICRGYLFASNDTLNTVEAAGRTQSLWVPNMCLYRNRKQPESPSIVLQQHQLGLSKTYPVAVPPEKKPKEVKVKEKEVDKDIKPAKPQVGGSGKKSGKQAKEKKQDEKEDPAPDGNNKEADEEQFDNAVVPPCPPSDDDTLKGVGHEMPKFET